MSRVHTILPPPFVWITVPAGKVVVITHQGCAENHLPAYAFAKYPLTNAQFSPFIQAGGYQQPQWWTNAGWQARARHNWTQPRYWDHAQWNGTDHPVVGVSWYEAVAYCRWLSDTSGETVTLPTEPEW